MAIVRLAEAGVQRLGAQVIDVRVSPELLARRVVAAAELRHEIRRGAAARLSEERIELATNEVAAVERGELDELRFAFGVTKAL